MWVGWKLGRCVDNREARLGSEGWLFWELYVFFVGR